MGALLLCPSVGKKIFYRERDSGRGRVSVHLTKFAGGFPNIRIDLNQLRNKAYLTEEDNLWP